MVRNSGSGKRVVILGAGLGGLYIAAKLKGFDITVYEKRRRDELGYPWYDAVDKDAFKKVGLTLPSDAYTNKQVLRFFSPSGCGYISQAMRASRNLDVDRKKLIEFMLQLAQDNSEIRFGVEAEDLIIDNDNVVGVTINGRAEYCDLVIDSSGMFSKYRKQIPQRFCMNDDIGQYDFLKCYRGFYSKTDVAPAPSNVYLMPEHYSVLWCKDAENSALSDVLISKFATLDESQIKEALDYISKRNPYISDNCVRFAEDSIPVRYPLATIVANGYAIIGNAAFMTKPTSGSGIENTLKAAAILADIIQKATDFSAQSLWQYAVRVNNSFGASCYMSFIARSRFQNLDRNHLIWLFDSGILNESLLAFARLDIRNQETFQLRSIFESLSLAKSRPDFIKQIRNILLKSAKGKILATRMPRIYDENAIRKWKEEYDAFAREYLEE